MVVWLGRNKGWVFVLFEQASHAVFCGFFVLLVLFKRQRAYY
jgi:hypothetical protein